MSKKEAPLNQLQYFLPPAAFQDVLNYLHIHKIHLTVTRQRKSILGDYRHRTHVHNHRISINGNLNPFAFLVTLLHEIAHLLTFEQFGNKVQGHGLEWKRIYAGLLKKFLDNKIFPADVERELLQSLSSPAASSCAEVGLIRVLRKYDKTNGTRLVEEVPLHEYFKTGDGKVFQKGEKQRKRFKCTEVKTGMIYLFSPVYEVEVVRG
jgi:hypothetical protein